MLTMEDGNATSATPATINIQPALVNIIMNVLRILMKLRWSILKMFEDVVQKYSILRNTKGCLYQQLKIVLVTGLAQLGDRAARVG